MTCPPYYPYQEIPGDSIAVVRFLPDKDPDNELGFMVENFHHALVLQGKRQNVPCPHTYGESCPICETAQRYFAYGNKALGRQYYRKKTYLAQVLVLDSPIDHDRNALVKLIEFDTSIFREIQAAFVEGYFDTLPFLFKGGYNFHIRKTKKDTYMGSGFERKPTDLDDDFIKQLTLCDLKDHRPPRTERAVPQAMLAAQPKA